MTFNIPMDRIAAAGREPTMPETAAATHTPGDWALDYLPGSAVAPGGAIILSDGVVIGGAATRADGTLMTAAPALLAALRFIAESIEGGAADGPPLYGALHLAQHARAAIRDATS